MEKIKNRYSDKELSEFKVIIESKLKEAKVDLSLLKGSLSHKDDHGTDDTGRSFNMMEDGSETLMREEMAQLAARQEKFIFWNWIFVLSRSKIWRLVRYKRF